MKTILIVFLIITISIMICIFHVRLAEKRQDKCESQCISNIKDDCDITKKDCILKHSIRELNCILECANGYKV